MKKMTTTEKSRAETHIAFADRRGDKRYYMQNYEKVPKVLQP